MALANNIDSALVLQKSAKLRSVKVNVSKQAVLGC